MSLAKSWTLGRSTPEPDSHSVPHWPYKADGAPVPPITYQKSTSIFKWVSCFEGTVLESSKVYLETHPAGALDVYKDFYNIPLKVGD